MELSPHWLWLLLNPSERNAERRFITSSSLLPFCSLSCSPVEAHFPPPIMRATVAALLLLLSLCASTATAG